MRQYSDEHYTRLKVATHNLIRAAGGVEAAASLTRLNKSQLGNCANINSDQFLPADAQADLEGYTGNYTLSNELKRLRDGEQIPAAPLNKLTVAALRESTEAVAASFSAAEDGYYSPQELRNIIRESSEAIIALENLRRSAETKQGGK